MNRLLKAGGLSNRVDFQVGIKQTPNRAANRLVVVGQKDGDRHNASPVLLEEIKCVPFESFPSGML
jgi:hypothetical protein